MVMRCSFVPMSQCPDQIYTDLLFLHDEDLKRSKTRRKVSFAINGEDLCWASTAADDQRDGYGSMGFSSKDSWRIRL
jgi:hypothetical protein